MTSKQTVTVELPSVQSLLLDVRFDETSLGSATGFVVDSAIGPLLVTNRHVVTGRDNSTNALLSDTGAIPNNIIVRHNGHTSEGARLDAVVSAREDLYSDEVPRWFEHPTLGRRADIVALRLTNLSQVELYPVDTSDSSIKLVSHPSESVSIIGFPFGKSGPGNFAIWAAGTIASEMQIPYNGLPVFLVDSRSRTGQSGSPVIAYRAGSAEIRYRTSIFMQGQDAPLRQFLGVYSGRIHRDSDIGMVWTAAALRDLVLAAEASVGSI
jgi:hypothetical protein